MPSLLSRLAALYLSRWHRPVFLSAGSMRARLAVVRASEDARPPPRIIGGLRVSRRELRGAAVYELAMPGAKGTALLYLHGGAFCFQISPYHWKLVAELALGTGRPVVVPIYPLAPEHGAAEVFDFLIELWREMTAGGARPAVVGDSAGGNLALVLTMLAAEQGLSGPSALGLLSPCVDMTLRHPEIHDFAARDPWLAIDGALEAVKLYARDIPLSDWRISPCFGDLKTLPPSLMTIGTKELLYPDLRDMVEEIRELGGEVELIEGAGLFHGWPLLPIPEARPAKARLLAFLRARAAP